MPRDATHILIHALCGAMLGAAIGLGGWLIFETSALIAIGAPALLFAILAAIWGDSFWEYVADRWRWWW